MRGEDHEIHVGIGCLPDKSQGAEDVDALSLS